MKRIILLLIMVSFFEAAQSQQQDSLRFNSVQDRAKFNHVNTRRTKNSTFSRQTLNYSPLSYACPPYFDLGSPKKWYVLSADIIPEFIIASPRLPFVVHLTTRFKVRIFHNDKAAGDSSVPVRTPSFMPGATVFVPLGYINDKEVLIKYIGLSYFHHSNGQDGREFNANGSFNLYNGNFSTNYIEPSFHFRKRKYLMAMVSSKPQQPERNYKDFYGSAGVEFHFSTADALKSSYGNERINFQLGLISVINYWNEYKGHKLDNYYYGERDRIVFNGTFIAGARDKGLSALNKRINTDLNYYWRIRSSPNASLFASAGYYGSDTYNIYYANSYFFVRAGIALGFFITSNL